jgi:hypothetical protein
MTSAMKTVWNIERRWVWGEPLEQATLSTLDLANVQGVALLGSAGMGKSWEIQRLIQHEKALGRDVHSAEIGRKSASGRLDKCLEETAQKLSVNSSIFLDGLDEALVANPQATAIVNDWIRESIIKRCRIRISCRSAIWPKVLHETICEYCFPEQIIAAELQRLRIDDVRKILICENLEPDLCLDQIHRSRVSTLAQQPITLKLLIEELSAGSFSSNRSELFKNAVRRMCVESLERDELGTGASRKLPEHKLIEAAERLAVYVVTTGRELIGIGADIPSSDQLISLNELAQLPADSGLEFNTLLLRALADTGLFIGGPDSGYMQFCERNIAEYLAGSRLAKLPLFQSRSILGKDSGWKTGVAGPLRETAAFAASENSDLARWIAETDPEVVGLSEVASDDLRRVAFEHTVSLFRNHKLTDSQIARGSVWLSGLFHEDVIHRLKEILSERGDGVEDVHAFAIAMCETCSLQELAPHLGALIRDHDVYFMTRKNAGYALISLASPAGRQELIPLLHAGCDFESQELLGLALRANWPQNVTTTQLLALLSDPVDPYHSGAYQGFLHHLELENFDAANHRVEGLKWAILVLDYGRDSRLLRLAQNIVLASVEEHGDDEVLSLFLDFFLKAEDLYLEVFDERKSFHEEHIGLFRCALASDSTLRRRIISGLVARNLTRIKLENAYHTVPGLKSIEDFEWLLEQAKRSGDNDAAESYAQLACALDWNRSSILTALWWNAIESEPIRKFFLPIPFVEINSDLARLMKEDFDEVQNFKERKKHTPVVLDPPPEVRVAAAVKAATRNPLVFPAVVRELTLKATSTHYAFSRIVSQTPGWASATETLKTEIVESAKKYLNVFEPVRSASAKQTLNTIYLGPLSAFLLVLEIDRAWLCNHSDDWWDTWSWQILRDLKLDLHDEQNEPKENLLKLLYSTAPNSVANHMAAMAKRRDVKCNLESILERLAPIANQTLVRALLDGVLRRDFSGDALSSVCAFLLKAGDDVVDSLAGQMSANTQNRPLTPTARIACSLLQHRPIESWLSVNALFKKRPDIAKHVLGQFAYETRRGIREELDLPCELAGQILSALFRAFPPEEDPKHEGAHYVDYVDAAVCLRTQLLNHLTVCEDEGARGAVRQLEIEFGQRYPWLRRARAHADQLLLMNRWQPIPLQSVASILHASEKRLLRSGEDVIEAIMYALENYDRQLHLPPPSTLNALWNDGAIQNKVFVSVPYPRQEEHVSDEVKKAIQLVFDGFAVTASREVQIFRRRVSGDSGSPGSLTDVFVEVPAPGTLDGTKLTVIVEVKRSCNSEVKHALQTQLVDRYLVEEGTNFGVYVVAFFDSEAFEMRPSYKPKWSGIETARSELESQAVDVSVNGRTVKSYVLDARID